MTAIGFAPFAAPTARTARGRPICAACATYDTVVPNGMVSRPRHASSWNSVPRRSSGTVNPRRSPAKYSASSRAACSMNCWPGRGPAWAPAAHTKPHSTTPRSLAAMRSNPTGELTTPVARTSFCGVVAIMRAGPGRLCRSILLLTTRYARPMRRFFAAAISAFLAGAAHAAQPATLHVSPTGNDANSGLSPDQPLRSPIGAGVRVRALRAEDPRRPITVVFADGLYVLDATWELTSADSGAADAPITYAAAPGAKPVLSGGVALPRWQETQVNGR